MAEAPGPISSAVARLVGWIVESRARALAVVFACLVLGALSLAYGRGIKVDTDLKALLPPEAPSLRALNDLKARTGATEALSVAVQGPDDAANAAVAAALAEEVATWDETVGEVSLGRSYTPLRDHGLYFMSVEDLEKLRDTLVEQRQRAVASAMAIGDGPGPDAADVVAGDDWDTFGDFDEPAPPDDADARGDGGSENPADASDDVPTDDKGRVDLRKWLSDQREALYDNDRLSRREVDLIWLDEDDEGNLVWEDQVLAPYRSREGDARLLRARLSKPPTNVRFAQEAYRRLVAKHDALVAQGIAAPEQRVVVTGAYDVSADFDQILVDLQWATWLSASLVLGVLALGFRSLRGVVLVIVPLGTAMLVTLGIARAMYGELNALTAFLFAVLFGMGVDFAVHLFAQRRAQGAVANWPRVIERHFRPLLATMVTTAGSLFVLSIAVFKAFREFGIISGIGVIVCFVLAVLLVPALDTLMGPLPPRARPLPPPPAAADADKPRDEAPRAAAGAWRYIRYGLLALAVGVGAVGLPRLDFERDTNRLKAPKGKRGGQIKMERSRQCNKPLVLVGEDREGLEEAVARLEAIKGKELLPGRVEVPDDPSRPWIKSIYSLGTAMPADQTAKAELVGEIRRQTSDFLAELPDLDDEAKSYRGHLEALEKLAGNDPLTTEELPEWARAPFEEKDGTVGRLAHVCLSIHSSELDELVATSARLETLLDGTDVQAADSRLILADLLDLVQQDARRLPGVALLVILIMIALDLREPRGTASCFASLVVGLLTATGVMGLANMNLNFFNLVVMPAVVGLGIDASIHLWHSRAHGQTPPDEEAPDDDAPRPTATARASSSGGLSPTGQGSLIAALTTLGGFAGLLVASHPGLHSIGEVGVVCIIGCVGMAFVALYPFERR